MTKNCSYRLLLILLLGLLSGCGIATFSVGISQVSHWFPQSRQGWALGTYAGIGNIAPGLFAFLLPLALGTWGLAGSYLAWLIFLVVGTARGCVGVRPLPSPPPLRRGGDIFLPLRPAEAGGG